MVSDSVVSMLPSIPTFADTVAVRSSLIRRTGFIAFPGSVMFP